MLNTVGRSSAGRATGYLTGAPRPAKASRSLYAAEPVRAGLAAEGAGGPVPGGLSFLVAGGRGSRPRSGAGGRGVDECRMPQPDQPPSPVSRAQLVGLLSAAAAVLLVVFGILASRYAGGKRWERAQAELKARALEWESTTPFERAPLWGEPERGSAWNSYHLAIQEVARTVSEEERRALPLCFNTGASRRGKPRTEAELDLARIAIDELEPALALVREGAHRSDSRPSIDWDLGPSHPIMNLLWARDLVNAATAQTHLTLSTGTAIDDRGLLDALQFATDMFTTRPALIERMIGCALLGIVTTQAYDDRVLDALTPDQLRRLEAALAACDARFAATHTTAPLDLALTLSSPDLSRLGPMPFSRAWLWRYGFSTESAFAEMVRSEIDLRTELAARPPEPLAARRAWIESQSEAHAESNPVSGYLTGHQGSADANRVGAIAQLRLLRAVVALRLGARAVDLVDPITNAPFAWRDTPAGRVVSSPGPGRHPTERTVPHPAVEPPAPTGR